MRPISSIAFIGAGNVAGHLAIAFQDAGLEVPILIGRSPEPDERLPDRLREIYSNRTGALLSASADLIIAAVSDDAIEGVARKLGRTDIPVVHTSGAMPSSLLQPCHKRYGVFYPLQTLTLGEPTDLSDVPICIYASDKPLVTSLKQLAGRISGNVAELDDTERAWMHLMAVMLNNNLNHLMALMKQLSDQRELPFELLSPLLEETVRKGFRYDPARIQTGPARRNDTGTAAIHRALLAEQQGEGLMDIYDYFWRSIQRFYSDELSRKGDGD